MTPRTDAEMLAILQKAFDPSLIKQKGRFSYISHGLITQRLTEADPFWSSDVHHIHTSTDASGALHCAGVTLSLTLRFPDTGPVTRTESGGPQRQESFGLEIKNAQSDALKRAAMRFGVALSMWETLVDAEGDEDYHPTPPNGREEKVVIGGATVDQVALINSLAEQINDPDWVRSLIGKHGASRSSQLTTRQASAVITSLKNYKEMKRRDSVPA